MSRSRFEEDKSLKFEDYIKNSSLVNYGIDLNDCSRPDITKKFNYGIVWPIGAGGWFLFSSILSELGYGGNKRSFGFKKDKWEHYWLDRQVNEYHPVTYNYFTGVDDLIRSNFSKEIVTTTLNQDLDKLSMPFTEGSNDFAESIFCSHWLPVSILSNTNIHIKHLTYIRYSNWVRKALVHIKRLLKTGSSITAIAFLLGETTNEIKNNPKFLEHPFSFTGGEFSRILKVLQADYSKLFRKEDKTYILYFYAIWCIKRNFDMYDPAFFQRYILSLFQLYRYSCRSDVINDKKNSDYLVTVKEQQAIDYIKSTGKVDHFEVRDYDNLFFNLNTTLPIPKSKIARYSKRNLIILKRLAHYIPPGDLRITIMQNINTYYESIKSAL